MNSNLKIKDKTQPIESIKITPFRKNIRKTSAHKHNNYFEIIYLTSGKGKHTIDAQEFIICAPVVFIVRKEQVHFWDIETEPSGFVIIIKKEFINNSLDKEIKQLISKISAYPCLYPIKNCTVEQLFELLNREYQESNGTINAIIEGLTKALLAKLLQSEKPANSILSHKVTPFEKFKELLAQQKKLTNKVAYYADFFNTTPQNLNAICRRESKQSASEVLAEFIISEAKRLLLYTDLTITEISYSLDFKDNSHFTKYFKKHVGVPPNIFRLTTK